MCDAAIRICRLDYKWQEWFINTTDVASATANDGANHTSGALTGVYAETVVPSGSYILYSKDEKVGFYKVDGSTNKVAANRAYLTADDAGVKSLFIDFDGEETGIQEIGQLDRSAQSDASHLNNYYDISGRRVAKPTKGLYIVNGKKIVIK